MYKDERNYFGNHECFWKPTLRMSPNVKVLPKNGDAHLAVSK
ncbi:10086_t:CDS:2 [Racocetra persica]|uniref:10086_t:CDS:1 n=1 Tax=Racocetra persica TaxID=160502 RepID=A0ACA9KAV8_9GLOM|nr:10086_t:CDS:2 [Racocetra persica]